MVEIQLIFLAHGINHIITSIVLQVLRFKAFEDIFLENMEPFQWTKYRPFPCQFHCFLFNSNRSHWRQENLFHPVLNQESNLS